MLRGDLLQTKWVLLLDWSFPRVAASHYDDARSAWQVSSVFISGLWHNLLTACVFFWHREDLYFFFFFFELVCRGYCALCLLLLFCVCYGEGGMIITIIRLAEQPKTWDCCRRQLLKGPRSCCREGEMKQQLLYITTHDHETSIPMWCRQVIHLFVTAAEPCIITVLFLSDQKCSRLQCSV